MKQVRSRLIKAEPILALAIVAGLLVAACSPTADTPGAAPTQASATTESGEPGSTQGPAASRDPVTIRFFEWVGQPQNDYHTELIADFMAQHPWITVDHQIVPFNEFFATLNASIAARNVPDVMASDISQTNSFAANGVISPLVPHVYATEEEAQADMEDFVPSFVQQTTYEGQWYAVGTRTSSVALYYNTDMLSEAGIHAPTELEDAWTMEQAREHWLALTQRASPDEPPTVWGVLGRGGGMLGLGAYHGIGMVRSAGEPDSVTYQGMSPDGLSIDGYLNTPEAIEALQFLQNLHQVDKVVPLDVIQNGFETGQAATYEFPEPLIFTLESQYPDLNWSVTPLPYFKTGFTHDGSIVYTMAANSGQLEAAGLLVRFMTNPETSLRVFQLSNALPVRQSVYNQITDYDELPRKIFYEELINWAQPRQPSVAYVEYSEIVTAGLRDIMLGAPVEQTVQQMVADFETAAAAYR